MGLTVIIFGTAIILIAVLLIITVVSPDAWGNASAGCNRNCCPSSQNGSGGSCSEEVETREQKEWMKMKQKMSNYID